MIVKRCLIAWRRRGRAGRAGRWARSNGSVFWPALRPVAIVCFVVCWLSKPILQSSKQHNTDFVICKMSNAFNFSHCQTFINVN
jgi:hypothetical protein